MDEALCGLVYVKSTISELMDRFASVRRADIGGLGDNGPRFIPARRPRARPFWRHIHLRALRFIPCWAKESRPQINAPCERISSSGMFRGAYRARRA
jgi:hypothetical protein